MQTGRNNSWGNKRGINVYEKAARWCGGLGKAMVVGESAGCYAVPVAVCERGGDVV